MEGRKRAEEEEEEKGKKRRGKKKRRNEEGRRGEKERKKLRSWSMRLRMRGTQSLFRLPPSSSGGSGGVDVRFHTSSNDGYETVSIRFFRLGSGLNPFVFISDAQLWHAFVG